MKSGYFKFIVFTIVVIFSFIAFAGFTTLKSEHRQEMYALNSQMHIARQQHVQTQTRLLEQLAQEQSQIQNLEQQLAQTQQQIRQAKQDKQISSPVSVKQTRPRGRHVRVKDPTATLLDDDPTSGIGDLLKKDDPLRGIRL